jgi:hypothetical protein
MKGSTPHASRATSREAQRSHDRRLGRRRPGRACARRRRNGNLGRRLEAGRPRLLLRQRAPLRDSYTGDLHGKHHRRELRSHVARRKGPTRRLRRQAAVRRDRTEEHGRRLPRPDRPHGSDAPRPRSVQGHLRRPCRGSRSRPARGRAVLGGQGLRSQGPTVVGPPLGQMVDRRHECRRLSRRRGDARCRRQGAGGAVGRNRVEPLRGRAARRRTAHVRGAFSRGSRRSAKTVLAS